MNNPQMAKKKISQFSKIEELSKEALIPIVQNYDNYVTTPVELAKIIEEISGNKDQIQVDWSQTNSAALDYIKNKPSIPAAQVNSDWNATSGIAEIKNKPIIPQGQIQSDWNQTSTTALDFIKNKPVIPTIPTIVTPVQSNWIEADTNSLAFIKNKPTLISQTDVNNTIINALNKFKVEVFNKNTSLSNTSFELDNYINTSYDRNINSDASLSETTASSNLNEVATICTIGYTNTGTSTIKLTIPNTGNHKCMMTSPIELEAGKYVEIAMKGNGMKRVWTYLIQE